MAANRFQVVLEKFRTLGHLAVGEVLRPLQRQPPAPLEDRLVAVCSELFDLGRAHLVDRLVHSLGNMKPVQHVQRVTGLLDDDFQVGPPHVAADEFDVRGLRYPDAFVRKYSPAGVMLWTQQFSPDDGFAFAEGVATDALGNVYVTGDATGSLESPSAGRNDAFLRKYDASGTVIWTRQFGSTAIEIGSSVAIDSMAKIYVGGD